MRCHVGIYTYSCYNSFVFHMYIFAWWHHVHVKGQGQTPKNWGTLIPVYNRYTHSKRTQKVGGPLLAALAAAMCSLLLSICEGSHSVRLYSLYYASISHDEWHKYLSNSDLVSREAYRCPHLNISFVTIYMGQWRDVSVTCKYMQNLQNL